jgi:hypothetical protein
MNKQVAKTQDVSIEASAAGAKLAPQDLGQLMAFAEVMSKSDIALPKHLRGNHGACLAVAMQAFEWEMSPFAVASKSYQVNGAIAYEAQLIQAVVNTRSKTKGRLKADYYGKGQELTCKITGEFEDGEVREYTSPPVGAISPKNSPLWKTDPEQQLYYYSSRAWARRWCPEVILGVYDREEMEHFGPEDAKDITPTAERLKAAKDTAASKTVVGDTGWVQKEDDWETSHVEPMQEGFDIDRVINDVAEAITVPQEDSDGPSSQTVLPSDAEEEVAEETTGASSSASHKSLPIAAKAMFAISKTDMSRQDKKEMLDQVAVEWSKSLGKENHEVLSGIYRSAISLIKEEVDRPRVLTQWAEWLNCMTEDLDD